MTLAISFDDVAAAAQRLAGVAHRTPVMTSRTADALCGGTLFFKCENLQRMGAFKFRGAYNALAQFTPEQRRAGVIAFSSGNHAQAIALSSGLLDMPAALDAAVERAVAAGGRVATPRVELPQGMGCFAQIIDSEGNRVGLHAMS